MNLPTSSFSAPRPLCASAPASPCARSSSEPAPAPLLAAKCTRGGCRRCEGQAKKRGVPPTLPACEGTLLPHGKAEKTLEALRCCF